MRITTRAHRPGSTRAAAALACIVLGATVALVPGPPASAAVAPPAPQPARTGRPATMAAIGDSITQATGTGELSKENPKNNWATGSDIDSVRMQLQIAGGSARNESANGARMTDAAGQVTNGKSGGSGSVAAVDSSTQYVVIEMGGNDLCRGSVGDMTSVTAYRTQYRAALAAIKARAPEALVFTMSVPDIYNLWYIRGATQHPTLHPEKESDQASGLNGARFYWDQSWFPCGSLLANPTSWAQADRDRRALVRSRTKEFNTVLAEECAKVLRCRFDANRLFDYTSNRVSPTSSALLPQAQWRFTDADISRNEGAGRYLCPVQGVIAGGCGDHFHPTKLGQQKVANSAMAASYDWSDTTPPTVGLAASPAPRADGTFASPVSVSFSGADARGLRGQEVRVHGPAGAVSPWSESVGLHPPITVQGVGISYVEARSFDVNGNRSASKVLKVDLGPVAPGAPALTTSQGRDQVVRVGWAPPADTGNSPVTGYRVELTRFGQAPEGTDVAGAGTQADIPISNGTVYRARVAARNAKGLGAFSGYGPAIVAPFPTGAAFLDRSFRDLALRPPTATELDVKGASLTAYDLTPAEVIAALVHGQAWDGVMGPVIRLYQAYFLRQPDTAGLAHWTGQARAGTSLADISQRFARSSEFVARYGSLSNAAFVDRIYLNVLGRPGETSGRAFWTAELDAGRRNRGQVMAGFSESREYRATTRTMVDAVLAYQGLLGRVPTAAELGAARATIAAGSLTDVINGLLASRAYAARVS